MNNFNTSSSSARSSAFSSPTAPASTNNKTEIQVLLIENNPDVALFIEIMLNEAANANLKFNLTTKTTLATGIPHLNQHNIDVVLLNLDLPDSQGLETLVQVQTQMPDIPVLILSSLDSQPLSIEAVANGAQDYLIKGKVDADLLACTIRYAIEHQRMAQEQQHLLVAERSQRLRAETLTEVILALTSKNCHGDVLDEILCQAQRIAPYSTAHIMLLEDDTLRTVRWRGHEAFGAEEYISKLAQNLADLPMDADVVRQQKTVVISDTARELRWVMLNRSNWIRSHVTMPICHHHRVLGLLRLDSDQVNAFMDEHIEELQPLANAAAIAIENARLHEQAQRDAKTKADLLQEVNHRVKNNLSTIISLLYAERRYAGVKEGDPHWTIMKELVNRVQGLTIVHNLLSASEWEPLLINDLVQQVVEVNLKSLLRPKEVVVEIEPSQIRINSEQANHVALIINELVANSVKHSLVERDQAWIKINICNKQDSISLEYRDDGPGYPASVQRLETYNLGLYLLQTLVRDGLSGTLSLHNDNGAVTTIQFDPTK